MTINYISRIYRILNLVTGDYYIGQSEQIGQRWKYHILDLRANRHHNTKLQAAWNKYGSAKFQFDIIEVCCPNLLNQREDYYIDKANFDRTVLSYNFKTKGGIPIWTKERRQKASERMIGNTHTKGRIRPKEECAKISAGNSGKKRTPEQIERYRRAAQKREQRNRELSQAIPVVKPWLGV